jgi:hypothetical protein
MAPFKDKHHPATLSDVGTSPVGPAGVVLEEWRAMRHFHALTRDRGLHVGSGSTTVLTIPKLHFRSTTNNGYHQTGPVGAFRHKTGHCVACRV